MNPFLGKVAVEVSTAVHIQKRMYSPEWYWVQRNTKPQPPFDRPLD
ncbi:MAG: hypothetical protein ACI9U6_002700, partial [Loktanella salsilacus]